MKRIKKILVTTAFVFAVVAMQSCSNGAKICGAYAQHDLDNKPDYHDVQ